MVLRDWERVLFAKESPGKKGVVSTSQKNSKSGPKHYRRQHVLGVFFFGLLLIHFSTWTASIYRLIYYLLVTSEAMAISSLLVLPVLIYMIPQFIIFVFAICILVFGLTLLIVYANHRNHLN